MSNFYKYFKENMDALGLPAPDSLFGNFQLALSSAVALVALIDKLGKKVTVMELIGAGIRAERLVVIGAMSASYYVGAVIGSIAVATARTFAGSRSISDILINAQMNHLHRPWLAGVLVRHPEIYKRRKK
jgi:hypothetical protein